ncbi:MAG: hypothetical protein R2707_10915 [Acidimicrobiales bacterium]
MRRPAALVMGAAMLVVASVAPVSAQTDDITVTPAVDLLDGQTVDVSATTTGSDYATLALCPADAAPTVGADATDLVSLRNVCTGLVCFHDGDMDLASRILATGCPLAVQPRPIAVVSTSVALPRWTGDGTDCAIADCVVVFNTWSFDSAQGAVSAPVRFDETVTGSTTTTSVSPATTTTIELSAPSASSTVPPTTVATQVLGTQETNDGQLAVTGFGAGVLVALAIGFVMVGGVAVAGSRRHLLSRRPR